ncbi:hypothetical protein PGT21_034562 [Puccinia graminis f. sp. tritici]|uniref:Uncharacterized protein n=1 Tax=Puccinia graminis f. sp. tritici TaxID=56615 RepID=A0A5B0LL44_PUCGR|nr:hypothetical protein PGTUg99_022373 [Puccinia graminis f. sp. tritici]KAA1095012.1 hypothetical protein PGT21_034562 [Puccinia graminis f. sp. tritici]
MIINGPYNQMARLKNQQTVSLRYGQTAAQVTSPHFNPVSTNHVILGWIDAINPNKG